MSPDRTYSGSPSYSSSSLCSSSSSSPSPAPSVNPNLSKLESLLRSGHAVDISVESPSTHAVQRIHYMCTEDDMENEAQAWERYVEEYCFPASVIEDFYGHIEGFRILAGALFDARQSSVAGVCKALSNIPIGHPLPLTGYHKSKLLAAFAVARRADEMLTCYARRVLRYKLKFPDGPDPTVARIRHSMYLEPHVDDRDDIGDDFDPFATVEPVPTSNRFAMTPPRHGEPSYSNPPSDQDDPHDEDSHNGEEHEESSSVSGTSEEEEEVQQEAEIEFGYQTSVAEDSEDVEQQETEEEPESPLVGGKALAIARLRDGGPRNAPATKVGNRPSKKMSKGGTAAREPHFQEPEVGAKTIRFARPMVAVEIPIRKRARSPEQMSTSKKRSSRTKGTATPSPDTASKPDTGLKLSEVTFPIECPQPKCSVTINDMNDARSHWVAHPLGQYRCPRCKNRAIKSADALGRHVTIVHRLDLRAPVVLEQIELGNQRLTQMWRKALGLDVTGYFEVYRWDQ